jgi:TIR domain/NACHT domain
VNGQDSRAEIFDVFLCHNSEDKPAVRQIALKLVKEGIKPWLDVDQIRPGTSWQTALGEQIGGIKSAAVFLADSGLGPWQNQESQAFLNQLVERKCPVIPVILPSAKGTPELPWTLANLHRVDFRTDSQPIERLIWGITGQKPAGLSNLLPSEKPATMQEAVKPRLTEGRREQAPEDRVSPLSNPPDPDNATQLRILRKRVMEYWVDGVLKHSLYNEVLISLDKRRDDKSVDAPWKYSVEMSDADNSTRLDDRDVITIYDATGLLLILGEPGGGKTTTLLGLARTLLERAQNEITERVPIVVNLSSWKKKQPIEEWISAELSEKYRVPKKIARLWLQRDYLIPLLDGLDEMETSTQSDCVTAINEFIESCNPSERSSRTAEAGDQSAAEPFVLGSWLGGTGRFSYGECASCRLEPGLWRTRLHRETDEE